MSDWINKKVVIIGAARQGIALARYLLLHGAMVVMTDKRPLSELSAAQEALSDVSSARHALKWVCGDHPLSLLDGANLVCLSGGVPLTLPLVIEAQKRNIPLSNDSQIFLETAPCKVIGITGSAGKTTTTSLVGCIALASIRQVGGTGSYRQSWIGGNIGSPLISDMDGITKDDLAVMELSSFQLEIMNRSPQVAALLNVTPNHLDRHGTMDAYIAAKARILDFQSHDDVAVLGRDDPGAQSLLSHVRGKYLSFGRSELQVNQAGVYLRENDIYLHVTGQIAEVVTNYSAYGRTADDVRLMDCREIPLRGTHNVLNVMAACAIAAAAGLPAEAMHIAVKEFTGVAHRLEFVRRWKGADWYNDSIATAPERAMAAIHSFVEPLVLLAGGRDKNLPWEDFSDLVRRRVDHLILFGESADLIYQALSPTDDETLTVTRCKSLHDAVVEAAKLAQPGDVVLLSPGGTSFDEFEDFEERGECFVRWVEELP